MATHALKDKANHLMFQKIVDIAVKYANQNILDESDMVWLWQVDMVEYFILTLKNWGPTVTESDVSKVAAMLRA